ncbi:MAG TPA: efflux RND transporter periplasmic adaptor subunit [Chryseosolibacter sp.]|nr:efflux RND transporter periplasmic adaptor subunit [Chryseosolibacter sp.]
MSTTTKIMNAGVLILITLLIFACSQETAHEHDTYTCPMHPTVITDRPGSCPVCGMDLVRKARAGEEIKITEDLARLLKSPNEAVIASVKTIRGEYKKLPRNIEAPGVVTYDPRNIYSISARIAGRLEKVYVKYNLQRIKKGEKIAQIYSPEMLTVQRELLFLLENDKDNYALINGAKLKLKQLGASDSQIDRLVNTKEPASRFTIFSPYEGYVILPTQQSGQSTATAQETTGSMGAMTKSSTQRSPDETLPITQSTILREGDYVTAGQLLFTIVNPSALRIDINLTGKEGAAVNAGDTVLLQFEHGQKRTATIGLVEPYLEAEKEFRIARVYTTYVTSLQIGQIVSATIRMPGKESLWVPEKSVFDLGATHVVFVKERKVFKPKPVVTGVRAESMVEIKEGLSTSDEIAGNASFLVDSEGFIHLK